MTLLMNSVEYRIAVHTDEVVEASRRSGRGMLAIGT